MLAAMSKTEQRIDRNRGGITDTQVRFYQTVRKVVNIFAPAFCAKPYFWERTRFACWRLRKLSRVADFLFPLEIKIRWRNSWKVRFGATLKPARETRALLSYARGGVAAEWDVVLALREV